MNDILKILIVEDEAPKLAHIIKFFETYDHLKEISVAKSLNSALDELDSNLPDLIILDMSLPTFDVGERESGGRPQGFGGIEILRQMSMSDRYCPTIVITGYDAFKRSTGENVDLSQIRSELIKEFPDIIASVLHYNSTLDQWKRTLSEVLSQLLSNRSQK